MLARRVDPQSPSWPLNPDTCHFKLNLFLPLSGSYFVANPSAHARSKTQDKDMRFFGKSLWQVQIYSFLLPSLNRQETSGKLILFPLRALLIQVEGQGADLQIRLRVTLYM